jgi:hypothetical protein
VIYIRLLLLCGETNEVITDRIYSTDGDKQTMPAELR